MDWNEGSIPGCNHELLLPYRQALTNPVVSKYSIPSKGEWVTAAATSDLARTLQFARVILWRNASSYLTPQELDKGARN